jgi:hypothetical protein
MQIRLKELLENMTGEATSAATTPGASDGSVEASVEDGPSVASACPPTPRRVSAVDAAIDAASVEPEPPKRPTQELQAEDMEEAVSHRPVRRTTPPPPPPRREPTDEQSAAPVDISEQPTAPARGSSAEMDAVAGDEEYESQTFSPRMLSPLSGRKSNTMEAVVDLPRRDSGLIDVRSMAAAYREFGDLSKGKRPADAETVPLPILTEGTSPILLPQPTAPQTGRGWLYALVAVLGAIVVIGATVAITAMVLKRRDDGGQSFAALAPAERAALCEAEEEAAQIREEEERERVAAAARRAAATTASTTETDELPAAPTTTDPAAPRAVIIDVDDDDDKRSSRGSDRERRRDRDDEDEDEAEAAEVVASAPTPAAPTPTSPATPAATDDLAAASGAASSASPEGEKCDEVTCLVSGVGCCGKAPKKDKAEAAPDPSLPKRPSKEDISGAMASVKGRLQSCGDLHSVRGAVTVKVGIAASGSVKSASTSQGSAEFKSCVSSAVRGAKFPASQDGATVNYPVVLQ